MGLNRPKRPTRWGPTISGRHRPASQRLAGLCGDPGSHGVRRHVSNGRCLRTVAGTSSASSGYGRPGVAASPLAHSRAATYLDFLLPGVLALMVIQNSLFGIGSGLTRWKEKGILRRFRVTPLRPPELLGATVLNYIAVGLATSVIIIGIAVGFLHASIVLPIASGVLVLLLGMASFLSIGFIVAGISKTQEATIPIVNLISFPMMFFSGIFFPVSSLPKVLAHIVNYFPRTYLAGALRGLMSGQLTLGASALRTDLLDMAVWLVATGIIAARVWRWE